MSLEFKTVIPQEVGDQVPDIRVAIPHDLRHQAPDFIEKFGVARPKLEQEVELQAGSDFNQLFTDASLAHAGHARNINPNNLDNPIVMSTFGIPDDETLQSGWEVTLLSEPRRAPDGAVLDYDQQSARDISLVYVETDTEGEERRRSYITYRYDADGKVRRTDYGDEWYDSLDESPHLDLLEPSNDPTLERPESTPLEDAIARYFNVGVITVQAAGATEDNERANMDLEQQMGYNHQPVGPAEIAGLRKLVMSPDAVEI